MFEEISINKLLIVAVIGLAIFGAVIYLSAPKIEPAKDEQSSDLLSTPTGCVSIDDAQNFVGEEKCVSGLVEKVFISQKGTIFLDFCADYKTCPFTAVIFQSSGKKFDNVKQYESQNVKVSGTIKTYQGKPEIIINEPSQIEIIK